MWQRAEKEAAKKVKGRRSAGSGSVFSDNDVKTKFWSIEVKCRRSATLNNQLLTNVKVKALKSNKAPALMLQIDNHKVWVFFDEHVTYDEESGRFIVYP